MPTSILTNQDHNIYPYYFSEQFPDSHIITFTKNPQNAEPILQEDFRSEVLDITNNKELEKIVKNYKIDFIYTSDLLDHLNFFWGGESVADTLAENEVKWILFLHDSKNEKDKLERSLPYFTFLEKIKYHGYKVRRLFNYLNPDYPNYYLAKSPIKTKQFSLEEVFRIQINKNLAKIPTPA